MTPFPVVLEAISDLQKDQIDELLAKAKKFKQGAPTFKYAPLVATCFLENSTRTKNSFVVAAKRLHAAYLNFDAQTSSLQQGEDLTETFLTLHAQGVNLGIIRSSVSGLLHPFKQNPPFKIINGGDGMHAHPTQALLDLFTMLESGLDPKGKTIAIIGDNLHSRVAHSLIALLTMYGARIILCGPEGCLPEHAPHPQVALEPSLEKTIKAADLYYLLRVQKERHKKFGKTDYFADYHLTHGLSLKKLQERQLMRPVYHPGPANIGVEIDLDLIKSPLYQGYQQVAQGQRQITSLDSHNPMGAIHAKSY